MKKRLWKIKDKIKEIRNPIYIGRLVDEKRNITRDSLFKVVGKQKYLGHGNYGIVNKIKVKILNQEQGKDKYFASKNFKELEKKEYALEMFNEVKKTGVYTWTTYRDIVGTNSVLMTLGNDKNVLLFSSNNNSVDASKVLENPISIIENEEEFYYDCFYSVDNLTEQALKVPDDSYLFEYKEKKLRILTGDFDWKRKIVIRKNYDLKNLLIENLKYLLYALLNGRKYFWDKIFLFDGFAKVIKKELSKREEFSSKEIEKLLEDAQRCFFNK